MNYLLAFAATCTVFANGLCIVKCLGILGYLDYFSWGFQIFCVLAMRVLDINV
jgi:hypothetical protein